MATLFFITGVLLILGFPLHLVTGLVNPKLAFLNKRKAPKKHEAVLLSFGLLTLGTFLGVAAVTINPDLGETTETNSPARLEVEENKPVEKPVEEKEVEVEEITFSKFSNTAKNICSLLAETAVEEFNSKYPNNLRQSFIETKSMSDKDVHIFEVSGGLNFTSNCEAYKNMTAFNSLVENGVAVETAEITDEVNFILTGEY